MGMSLWCVDALSVGIPMSGSLGAATASSLTKQRFWCLTDEAGWCFDCKIRLVLVAGSPGDVWGTPLPLPGGTRAGYGADSSPAFEISPSTSGS